MELNTGGMPGLMAEDRRGVLYVLATPIGNLEDISLRALRILREVDLIAAEDTRNSAKLLHYYEINTSMTSYHKHNEYEKAGTLVSELEKGKNIALISDAGTPCISDPGLMLVKKARDAGIVVTGIPGPSALVDALAISGLSSRRFCFEGFLPLDKKERTLVFEDIRDESRTIVIYEAPHRIIRTLSELHECLGRDASRRIALCRELSKIHEEVEIFTIDEVVKYFENTEPRGEYVIVLEGKSLLEKEQEKIKAWGSIPLNEHIEKYLSQGMTEKDAMKKAARDRGVSKRDIYREYKGYQR